MRFTQVKKLDTAARLRAHLDELGVDIPFDDEVDPSGVLASPATITVLSESSCALGVSSMSRAYSDGSASRWVTRCRSMSSARYRTSWRRSLGVVTKVPPEHRVQNSPTIELSNAIELSSRKTSTGRP